MKRALIIISANISVHGRALKEIIALKPEYEIDTIGTAPAQIEEVGYFRLKEAPNLSTMGKLLMLFRIILGDYEGFFKSLEFGKRIEEFENIVEPDVIIAHNADGLYMANFIKKVKKWSAPIVLNMHEYLPRQSSTLKGKVLDAPYIRYLKKHCCDAKVIYTVGDSIAREYEKYLKLKPGAVLVTYNAPFYNESVKPHQTGNPIRLVTTGLSDPQRRLELMIEVMKKLPKESYSLDMYLMDVNHDYLVSLEGLAKEAGNVTIQKPVKYNEIVQTLNGYDVFLYMIYPENYSAKYCLPNKFFEAIQGRLALAIGPSPEMKNILEKYELGICSEDFKADSMAQAIKGLTRQKINQFKDNSDENAFMLSAESAMDKIRQIVKDVI